MVAEGLWQRFCPIPCSELQLNFEKIVLPETEPSAEAATRPRSRSSFEALVVLADAEVVHVDGVVTAVGHHDASVRLKANRAEPDFVPRDREPRLASLAAPGTQGAIQGASDEDATASGPSAHNPAIVPRDPASLQPALALAPICHLARCGARQERDIFAVVVDGAGRRDGAAVVHGVARTQGEVRRVPDLQLPVA